MLHEDVLFEQASAHEGRDAGIDHGRRAAQIGLQTGEATVIEALGDFVDKTALAAPAQIRRRFRQRRHIAELRVARGELGEQRAVIEFFLAARAVNEGDGSRVAACEQIENHRLRTRQTRATGQQQERLGRRPAHEETSERRGELEFVTDLEFAMQIAGRRTIGHQTHIQFDLMTRRRCACDGKGARLGEARQVQVEILARLKSETLTFEREPNALDGRGQVFDACDPRPIIADGETQGVWVFIDFRFDGDIRAQGCAAGQRLAFLPFEIHQRKARCVVVLDLARQHLDLAGAAQAVIAGIGQPDAGAQRAVEHALTVFDLERLAQRFDGQSVGHATPLALNSLGRADRSARVS